MAYWPNLQSKSPESRVDPSALDVSAFKRKQNGYSTQSAPRIVSYFPSLMLNSDVEIDVRVILIHYNYHHNQSTAGPGPLPILFGQNTTAISDP